MFVLGVDKEFVLGLFPVELLNAQEHQIDEEDYLDDANQEESKERTATLGKKASSATALRPAVAKIIKSL